MKILLLGEFSSLHKYLKEGLLELGDNNVKLYANGDGWKKIGGSDGDLFATNNSGFQRVYQFYCEPFSKSKSFRDYDVVQLIGPQVYSPVVNTPLINRIKKENGCLSLVAAGEDYALSQAYNEGKFEYYVFDSNKESLSNYTSDTMRSKMIVKTEKKVAALADTIIPSLYEYSVGYQNYDKLHGVIPFPVNLNGIQYRDNVPKEKLVFFHGLNREASKGTTYIRGALERLQAKYPNDVEVVIDGKMPFDKYTQVMSRANVVIDQCLSYGYGINACIAMAQGKVVMSGSRPETLQAFGVEQSPIVPIQPDVDQIYKQMEYLLDNKREIAEKGTQSRIYVETMHDHVCVAQRYVDAWKSTGKV